jgi:putative hydrolase of the HAD superfamily
MIKAVLFDYGGVLSPGGKTLTHIYAQLLGIPAEAVNLGELHRKFRRGDISAEDFFIELSQQYGKPVTAEEFVKYSDIFSKNQKVYTLAAKLRKHGIKTGILSNVYKLSGDVLNKDGYYKDFEPIVLSYNEGLAKPDPRFYQVAIKRLNVEPSEIIFVDDQDKCLSPAIEIGMQVIKAENEDQIVDDLKHLFKKDNGLEL